MGGGGLATRDTEPYIYSVYDMIYANICQYKLNMNGSKESINFCQGSRLSVKAGTSSHQASGRKLQQPLLALLSKRPASKKDQKADLNESYGPSGIKKLGKTRKVWTMAMLSLEFLCTNWWTSLVLHFSSSLFEQPQKFWKKEEILELQLIQLPSDSVTWYHTYYIRIIPYNHRII